MTELQKLETYYQMSKIFEKYAKTFKLKKVRVVGVEPSTDHRAITVNMEMLVHKPVDHVKFNITI